MKKPLSPHAFAELKNLGEAPVPATGVNPGVCRKLIDEGLATYAQLPSPFPSHRKGLHIAHLVITEQGRRRLGQVAIG